MSREIKFRAWIQADPYDESDSPKMEMCYDLAFEDYEPVNDLLGSVEHLMQYTGLKDKNGDNEIYECDIIDSDGNVIGNQYETPTLLEEKTNLLIQGFGTKAWLSTYKEAVERGCHDA